MDSYIETPGAAKAPKLREERELRMRGVEGTAVECQEIKLVSS